VSDLDTMTELTARAVTDAGLFALWNPARFEHITDYGSWEASLSEDEDIAGQAGAGNLVPIGIGGDGSFGFLVRADSAKAPELTEREQRYLKVSSKPYLFEADGTAHLSGIEYVSAAPPPATAAIGIPAGRYGVTVHLIDWAAEPGAQDAAGKPAEGALPDFVVLAGPAPDDGPFRTKAKTFDRLG
jgi:hypothetical protein